MTSQLALDLSTLQRSWLEFAEPLVLSTMVGKEFTSDDLHAVLPEPAERNWFGVLMAKLSSAGLVERVGFKTSERKEANGRAIRIWKLSAAI